MEPIKTITSKTVVIPIENVDTDQIIPARFLKVTSKVGIGEKLFCDWRYDAAGNPKPDFVLNKPEAKGAHVLVAGDNFGCGSSREHAPWALVGYGFRAIVSTSFADIFRSNALKNGLLPVVVDPATHKEALEAAEKHQEFAVDLPQQKLTLPSGRSVEFPIDPFQKNCLVRGVDEMGYLLTHEAQIAAFESKR
jgi:3-isopropylmalate/(R)-2-methylmalate dehydratase small subunit